MALLLSSTGASTRFAAGVPLKGARPTVRPSLAGQKSFQWVSNLPLSRDYSVLRILDSHEGADDAVVCMTEQGLAEIDRSVKTPCASIEMTVLTQIIV